MRKFSKTFTKFRLCEKLKFVGKACNLFIFRRQFSRKQMCIFFANFCYKLSTYKVQRSPKILAIHIETVRTVRHKFLKTYRYYQMLAKIQISTLIETPKYRHQNSKLAACLKGPVSGFSADPGSFPADRESFPAVLATWPGRGSWAAADRGSCWRRRAVS
jgi:hypothetical protein